MARMPRAKRTKASDSSVCPFQARLARKSIRKKFKKLVDFLSANVEYPEAYRNYTAARSCVAHWTPKERLIAVYFSALQSNTKSSKASRQKALRSFKEMVCALPQGKITRSGFLGLFDVKDFSAACSGVESAGIGFGKKKAALFLRDLYETQALPISQRIFHGCPLPDKVLKIPLDSVIAGLLNQLLGAQGGLLFRNQYDIKKRFDQLTVFAREELGERHMLIEDLWFWGFFGSQGVIRNGGFGRDFVIRREIQLRDPFFAIHPVPDRIFEKFHACFP